jgi:hypothetical protein
VVIIFDACRFLHHFSLQGRELLHILADDIAHSLEFPVDHDRFTFLSMRQQHRLITHPQVIRAQKQPAGNEPCGLGQQLTYRADDSMHWLARCIQKQHRQYDQRQYGEGHVIGPKQP